MMNLNSSLNSCQYRKLQCKGKDIQIYIWSHGQEKQRFSEPRQWTPQQYTVYNGKRTRRPTPFPGY
jgi:hypothetical protein